MNEQALIKQFLDNSNIPPNKLDYMLKIRDIRDMSTLDYAVMNGHVDSAILIMEKQIALNANLPSRVPNYCPLMLHYAALNPEITY